jgi:hypothetical protein
VGLKGTNPIQVLALDQFEISLVKFDLFWDFDILSKEEHKTK